MAWDDVPPQKHAGAAKGGWDSVSPSEHAAALPTEPSALESFGRGAVNQFGLAPVAVGAASSLPEVLKLLSGNGSLSEINQAYDKARDESQANFEAADAAHPAASLAGNVAGGIGTALLTAGLSEVPTTLAGAAKLGAGYGALSGAGESLAKGTDLKTGLANTASGAIMGAGTGSLIHGGIGAAKGLANLVGDSKAGGILKTAYGMGQEGENLLNPDVRKAIGQEGFETAQSIRDQIGQKAGGLRSLKGKAIGSIVDSADTAPQDANILTAKIEGLISGLDERDPQQAADKKLLANLLENYTTTSPDTIGDNIQLKPDDIQSMKTAFQNASPFAADSLKTGQGGAIAKQIAQLAGNTAETSIPGLETANNQFSSVDKANKLLGMNPLTVKPDEEALKKLSDRIYRYKNVTKTGDDSRRMIDAGIEQLDKVDPEMASNIKSQIQQTAQRIETARKATNESVHVGAGIPGMVMGASTMAANQVGRASAAISNSVGATSKALTSMMPQQLTELAQRVGQTSVGQKLGNILTQAAEKDETGRNALLFTLMQQPAYRDLLTPLLSGK